MLTGTQSANLNLYKQCGAEYTFSECEFPDRTSFHPLRIWLGYKLKWDPDQPVSPLLDRFFKGYYGKAAKAMRALYDMVETRQREAKSLDAADADGREWLDENFFVRAEKLFAEAERIAAGDIEVQKRIALERVPLDITRIRRIGDKPGLPPLDVIKERLRKNWPVSIHRFYNGEREGRYLKEMAEFFKMNEKSASGARYALPEELKNAKVFEITAQEINWTRALRSYGTLLADDPDAAGGKAVIVEKTLRTNPDTFHAKNARTFRFGVYSETGKKHLQQVSLPKNKIPKDEKYHWYRVPAVELAPATLVWASDWLIQHRLDSLYSRDGNNRYTVYLSLKFQGSAYVPGSKLANRVSCDRILAVENEK